MKKKRQFREDDFLFDEERELAIYRFLCKGKIKKKYKKLLSTFMFYRYADWKKYLTDKYRVFSIEGLQEFSKYLNQQVRENKAFSPIIVTYFSPVISWAITYFISLFISQLYEFGKTILNICIFLIAITILLCVVYIIQLNQDMRVMLYEDYKQIIDEIIEEKQEE